MDYYTLLTRPPIQQLSVYEEQTGVSFKSEYTGSTSTCNEEDGNEEEELPSRNNLSSDKINTSTAARDHFIGKGVLHSTQTIWFCFFFFLFAH